MSSASLSLRQGVHPDAVRIVAYAAAIAVNLTMLIAALRPLAADFEASRATPVATTDVVFHQPPKEVVPPPSIVLHALVAPTPVARPTPVPKMVSPPAAVPTEEGNQMAVPATPTIAPPSNVTAPAADAAPVEATLAYASAPAPAYPRIAIARHMEGTVMLRVLVDETGKPVDVVIESSSGHDLLDRAAREQVLSKWRFQPAQVNGQHVRAWARVPVSFDLRQS
jgi:protein TonB